MNIRKILYDILIFIAITGIIGGVYSVYRSRTPLQSPHTPGTVGETKKPNITYINATKDTIVVELPFEGAVTGKTFSVVGSARGNWFFEGSFPIEVTDSAGTVIARTIGKAQGDWMTTDFVPFKGDVVVPETFIGKAFLVLKKDNPSGLPEHDASVSFEFIIEY